LESRLKAAESEFGAASGAPGEFIAVRRSVFRPIPRHIINDDFWLTCDVLRRGMKVTFAADATATERVSEAMSGEYERRTRIAAGTWQVVLTHMQLANPRHGARAWIFTSHRVMRNVVVPVLLPCLWIGSIALARRSRLAAFLAVGQTLFYGSAAAGVAIDHAAFSAPTQFALTNLATLRGAVRLLGGRQSVAWRRVERGSTIMEDGLA
jgi:cellulose synthase/poly-beta-1,6-N-acetylglucosamine synthase-like glycosyltransferase